MLKRLKCHLKAIPFYLRTGEYVPHVFRDTYERAIIITDGCSFRVSDNLEHTAKEHVFPNGCLIRSKCKYCGAEDLRWYKDYDEWMRYVAPEQQSERGRHKRRKDVEPLLKAIKALEREVQRNEKKME